MHVNRMLRDRPSIIGNESLFNSVLAHFTVGFVTLTFVRQADWAGAASDPLRFAAGGTAAWLLVDVLSYFVHMIIDSETYDRLVCQRALKTGRGQLALIDQHHTFTLNYSYLNSVELVAVTYPAALPVLLPLAVAHSWTAPWLLGSPAYVGFYAVLSMFSLAAGHAHKWAHERNHGILCNPVVARLQDVGVLLGPEAHKKHHATHASFCDRYAFSLVTGFAQRLLDPVMRWFRR
jgi:hypothetical protein